MLLFFLVLVVPDVDVVTFAVFVDIAADSVVVDSVVANFMVVYGWC